MDVSAGGFAAPTLCSEKVQTQYESTADSVPSSLVSRISCWDLPSRLQTPDSTLRRRLRLQTPISISQSINQSINEKMKKSDNPTDQYRVRYLPSLQKKEQSCNNTPNEVLVGNIWNQRRGTC